MIHTEIQWVKVDRCSRSAQFSNKIRRTELRKDNLNKDGSASPKPPTGHKNIKEVEQGVDAQLEQRGAKTCGSCPPTSEVQLERDVRHLNLEEFVKVVYLWKVEVPEQAGIFQQLKEHPDHHQQDLPWLTISKRNPKQKQCLLRRDTSGLSYALGEQQYNNKVRV